MGTVVFFSYAHADNDSLGGVLERLHQEIQGAIWRISGDRSIKVFLDKEGIEFGQLWKQQIIDAVDEATFLIPIISPSYLASSNCCEEFERFLEFERNRLPQRNQAVDGLIFPISLVADWKENQNKSQITDEIRRRQCVDLEGLRHVRSVTGKETRMTVEALARRIVELIQRWPQSTATTTTKPTTMQSADDLAPLDWTRPEIQQLHKQIYKCIRESVRINLLYQKVSSELPPLQDRAADLMWKDAFDNLTNAQVFDQFLLLVLQDPGIAVIHNVAQAALDLLAEENGPQSFRRARRDR